jgi:hypothetical protein
MPTKLCCTSRTTGAYLDNPVSINQTSGLVTLNSTHINGGFSVATGISAGGNLSAAGATLTAVNAGLQLNRTTTTGYNYITMQHAGIGLWDFRTSADSSADFILNRFDGSIWSTSMSINRGTGVIGFAGQVNVTGLVYTSAGISTSGGVVGVSVQATNGTVLLSSPALTTSSQLNGTVGGVANWNIEMPQANSRAFTINRFNPSTGAYLGTSFSINHTTGQATFDTAINGNLQGTAANANSVPWTGVSGRPSIAATTGGGVSRWLEVSGMIIQCSHVAVTVTSAITSYTVNFPRGFPNSCVNVQLTLLNSVAGYAVMKVGWMTASQCSITVTDIREATPGGSATVMVTAYGY